MFECVCVRGCEALALSLQTRVRNPARSPRGRAGPQLKATVRRLFDFGPLRQDSDSSPKAGARASGLQSGECRVVFCVSVPAFSEATPFQSFARVIPPDLASGLEETAGPALVVRAASRENGCLHSSASALRPWARVAGDIRRCRRHVTACGRDCRMDQPSCVTVCGCRWGS